MLGAPSEEERAWLQRLPDYGVVPLPRMLRQVSLETALPDADVSAVLLAARLLRYAAPDRDSAAAALADAWFMREPPPLPRRDMLRLLGL